MIAKIAGLKKPKKACMTPYKGDNRGSRACCSNNYDGVFQHSDAIDLDPDPVIRLKCETVSGHDTRAGQQDCSVRKGLATVKVADQFFKGTFDLIYSGLSLEDDPTSTIDLQRNGPGPRHRLCGADHNARPDRAGVVIDFGLRQVKQIFPLDITRAHVVADSVANDGALGIDDQGQFRFGDIPLCVRPDADRFARTDNLFRERFEEDLRPRGAVDSVVGVGAEVGFLHSRLFAAQVCDTRRPDFLALDGAEQLDLVKGKSSQALLGKGLELFEGTLGFEKEGEIVYPCVG